jgi:hypothetical protein
MLEMMLGKSPSGSNLYPNSGPGTKTLQFGNSTLGYFGEVSGTELFYGKDLVLKFNIPTGTLNSWTGAQWFKFFRNNKVIYISRQMALSAIVWNDLYNSGLVYGVKGNGLYPVGAGVDQWNPIQKFDGTRNWYLLPRLPTGMGSDPASVVAANNEFDQLFGRVLVGANTPSDKWVSNALSYVGGNLNMSVQETSSSNVALFWARGDATGLTPKWSYSKVSPNSNWYPVLELIPDETLLDPYLVIGTSTGLQPPSILDSRQAQLGSGFNEALYNPVNVITLWPTKQPVVTGATFPGCALNPVNVTSSAAPDLNAFTISAIGTQLASDPANLVYSLADLNPFTVSGANVA